MIDDVDLTTYEYPRTDHRNRRRDRSPNAGTQATPHWCQLPNHRSKTEAWTQAECGRASTNQRGAEEEMETAEESGEAIKTLG